MKRYRINVDLVAENAVDGEWVKYEDTQQVCVWKKYDHNGIKSSIITTECGHEYHYTVGDYCQFCGKRKVVK